MRIGVDLMGGESPPQELFQAVLVAAEEFSSSDSLVVFATNKVVKELQARVGSKPFSNPAASIEFIAVSDFIEMEEHPLSAIRRKKHSSLVIGIRTMGDHRIDGLVSTGNTGALIACATMMLPLLPGIARPALLAVLPTKERTVAVLDVGGNVSVTAENLVQFAEMGAAYQQCSLGVERPRVGLLNIGSESLKGTSIVRQAYQTLKETSNKKLDFIGNVEGREVFDGKVDVLVTDGFSGNVFLKTAEGASSFLANAITESLKPFMNDALAAALKKLERYVNYEEYPGAIVCGIEGVVIKCHGASSSIGMLNAIRGAAALIRNELLTKIKSRLSPIPQLCD